MCQFDRFGSSYVCLHTCILDSAMISTGIDAYIATLGSDMRLSLKSAVDRPDILPTLSLDVFEISVFQQVTVFESQISTKMLFSGMTCV